MKMLLKAKFLLILAIAIVLAVLFFSLGEKNKEPVITKFKIEKGENVWDVAGNLKKASLIESRLNFVFFIYKEALQKEIKAGEYELNSNLKIDELARIITKGDIIEEDKNIKVTFPEGWSIKQIAARLKENGFSDEKFISLTNNPEYFAEKYGFEFLKVIPKGKNIEGYLFPDTYFLSPDMDEEVIVKKMLDNFDERLTEDLRNEIEKENKNVYEILTMASILEEEVKTQDDRKIVSGIFWGRLKSGQAFQSCATLAFILGENKKQYSYEDTRIESPYNTYLYPGLPPGPISNPGLDAIGAAVYPTNTDYNYFLNNPETGETVFSRTIDEHNANKVKNGL